MAEYRELTLSPKINPLSRSMQRAGSVEDILRSAGESYLKKLEQKRLAAVEERLKAITGSPQITRAAKKMQREGSVHDRLSLISKERTTKLTAARDALKKEEEDLLKGSFSPQINRSSRRLSRLGSVSDLLYQWGQDKRKKLDQERAKSSDERSPSPTPTISDRSRKLASKVCVKPVCDG
jgi:hypothetical protein